MSKRPTIYQSTDEEAKHVTRRLVEYNAKHAPYGHYEEINLCMKDEQGEIIAGLNSSISWHWMDIDILWVNGDYQGQGFGKQLLAKAEQIARSKNCTFIKLNTFSFQAPEFYKKNGYEIIGIIEDAPKGSHFYYLKKDLE